jgi:hypothetical protein
VHVHTDYHCHGDHNQQKGKFAVGAIRYLRSRFLIEAQLLVVALAPLGRAQQQIGFAYHLHAAGFLVGLADSLTRKIMIQAFPVTLFDLRLCRRWFDTQ